MKILIIVLLLSFAKVFGQLSNNKVHYLKLCHLADSLYTNKEYKESGLKYSEAFKYGASVFHRYNAACSYALAGNKDSSFIQLIRIQRSYDGYNHLVKDQDLNYLHDDSRWKTLLDSLKFYKVKREANLNKPLIVILDSIHEEDQKYRLQLDSLEEKYGVNSKEVDQQWKIISYKDSLNLIKVISILDKYGWLGPDVIGNRGNSTLFLVIQHSNYLTQKKYLPIMRNAVNNKKAAASDFALLEDRVFLAEGKKQTYGSQVGFDDVTKKNYVFPIEDPGNVDKRRFAVGLGSISEYLSHFGITWDVEQYKKEQKSKFKK